MPPSEAPTNPELPTTPGELFVLHVGQDFNTVYAFQELDDSSGEPMYEFVQAACQPNDTPRNMVISSSSRLGEIFCGKAFRIPANVLLELLNGVGVQQEADLVVRYRLQATPNLYRGERFNITIGSSVKTWRVCSLENGSYLLSDSDNAPELSIPMEEGRLSEINKFNGVLIPVWLFVRMLGQVTPLIVESQSKSDAIPGFNPIALQAAFSKLLKSHFPPIVPPEPRVAPRRAVDEETRNFNRAILEIRGLYQDILMGVRVQPLHFEGIEEDFQTMTAYAEAKGHGQEWLQKAFEKPYLHLLKHPSSEAKRLVALFQTHLGFAVPAPQPEQKVESQRPGLLAKFKGFFSRS